MISTAFASFVVVATALLVALFLYKAPRSGRAVDENSISFEELRLRYHIVYLNNGVTFVVLALLCIVIWYYCLVSISNWRDGRIGAAIRRLAESHFLDGAGDLRRIGVGGVSRGLPLQAKARSSIPRI